MNPAEKLKADFQFRRKQSLTGSAKNLEADNQTRRASFLARPALEQRYLTTTSAGFWVSQFYVFEGRSADLHGGRQRAKVSHRWRKQSFNLMHQNSYAVVRNLKAVFVVAVARL
jgi:hypothetical protein